MKTRDRQKSTSSGVSEKNTENFAEQKSCYVKNITNQKQIVELKGESLVLNPYEEKPVTHSEKELRANLSSFINLSILEILIK